MTKTTISELVELLAKPTLRVRTGIWLYPMDLLGEEENEAVRLDVIASDAQGNISRAASALLPLIPIPWVTSAEIGWDRSLLRQLDSGESLFILVEGPEEEKSRRGSGMVQSRYRCTGLLAGNRTLFHAETRLASLQELQRVRRARNA